MMKKLPPSIINRSSTEFKIMIDDLSEKKQKEFLKLAGLKSRRDLSELYNEKIPIASIEVNPNEFITTEEFFSRIKNL